MELCTRAYGHPDAVRLIARLQQVFVVRYGDEDVTPVDPAQFAAPRGHFVVGYLDREPVACGGWRAHDVAVDSIRPGDAEIKRMYTVDSVRGKGFARVVLAGLESAARAAGRTRMVLETGTRQPEAIGLYESSGYRPIDNFGVYRHHPDSLCYAKEL
ncbi:GNAT family N-acetyltransferase [Saccharothrix australiensis]|uniref:Acetyltransferase (GNAT) family protein n=1 Tax=Saccharothrix australiensis TaxID=2072 RepID=A0A495W5X9_9PSEU|nr:GNAT family N-acetyltransferase [Saccharothrix australiensis]RKT57106.1 acetyltransferase (GNAT) family protein [Saccharothrix australiensis]